MVASHAANTDSFEVTTPSDLEIRMTRLFNAPRRLVFDAMTKPEHVKQWWGRLGEGYSVPVCEIDLRVGGAWRFVNGHPRGEAAFHAALNTVNIGKYNLGWASIGICTHALYEAITHASNRVLYKMHVTDFAHVRQNSAFSTLPVRANRPLLDMSISLILS